MCSFVSTLNVPFYPLIHLPCLVIVVLALFCCRCQEVGVSVRCVTALKGVSYTGSLDNGQQNVALAVVDLSKLIKLMLGS